MTSCPREYVTAHLLEGTVPCVLCGGMHRARMQATSYAAWDTITGSVYGGYQKLLSCAERVQDTDSCMCLFLHDAHCRRLILFPKLQVFTYSLLLVPVVYGAGKLIAVSHSDGNMGSSAAAGVACAVILPVPVLGFWAYILYALQAEPSPANVSGKSTKRTRSSLLHIYKRPTVDDLGGRQESGEDSATRCQATAKQQRMAATLALLGDLDDNPTLVIRDKRAGEEELDTSIDLSSTSSESELEDGQQGTTHPANITLDGQTATTLDGHGTARLYTRPWRSLQSPMVSNAGMAWYMASGNANVCRQCTVL